MKVKNHLRKNSLLDNHCFNGLDFPAKITKIEVQKKRKSRVSLYLNDEFAFGLDAQLVAKYGLKEGDELSQETIADLLLKEERHRVREKAYRYLAGRAHSEKELRTKLIQKGYEQAIVEEVLSDLKGQKLVDDEAFALSFVRSRMVNRPAGEILLRRELWQKGVGEEIVEKAVQEAYRDKDQVEVAKELAKKRASRYQDLEDWKRKKRLADFLLRRGFEWEVVKEAIEKEFDD